VQAITINGQDVAGASGTTAAIDTGTTLVAGPVAFIEQIYAQLGGGRGDPRSLPGLWVYPCATGAVNVSFSFGGRAWSMDPKDFMFQQISRTQCIGAFIDLDLGGAGPTWIVGDAFLKNVYSVFRWDPPSVGFAQRGSGGFHSNNDGSSNGNNGNGNGADSAPSRLATAPFAAVIAIAMSCTLLFA
jgi:cathepsin D